MLNALLQQKLSIVTALPQTTRERVVGIDTRAGVQMIFLDTPGVLDPAYLLQRSMQQSVREAVPAADVVVLVMDSTVDRVPVLDDLAETLGGSFAQLIPVLNKIDIATTEQIQRASAWVTDNFSAPPAEVSAVTGSGVERLRQRIASLLPLSPYLYPPDEISSQPVRFFVAELVREAAFELYKQEIPYSVAVEVDEFREEVEPVRIRVTIYVERASQKGILIGKNGSAIRELGQRARSRIEQFLGYRVHLDTWVKVLPKWRKDPVALRRLGYPVPREGTT